MKINPLFWYKSNIKSYVVSFPTFLDKKENGGFDKINPKDCDGHRMIWVDWDSEPHSRTEIGVDRGICIKCGSRVLGTPG